MNNSTSVTNTILIVDDTPGNLELLIETLGNRGYQVFAAPSGQRALEFIKRQLPDLILLDVLMPEMDGFEVCRRLKDDDHLRDIPIIFLSSATEPLDKVTAFSLGAVDYITKPFEPIEVLSRVETHLSLSQLRKNLQQLVTERTLQLTEAVDRLEYEITERKQTEVSLRREENFIRNIFESAADAIIVFDDHQQIVRLNRRAQETFGYSNGELIGQSINVLLPQRFHKMHFEHFGSFAEGSEEMLQMGLTRLIRGQHKNGSEIPADATISKLADQNRTLFLFVMHDLTDRLAYEDAQRELETEREMREVKSQFFSMVAHDFRNPLASIRLSASSLNKYIDRMTPEQKVVKTERILHAVDRMNELLEDVLVTEQLGQSNLEYSFEDIDMVAFSHEVFVELMEVLGERHDVHYETNKSSVFMKVDPMLIRRVIGNLLSNAIKYSPNGGQVMFRLIDTSDKLMIAVSDSGIGIPQEDLPQLFELFHRADNVGSIKGTGIGLAIVKQIVDIHSGDINVDSQVNRGTTFEIVLPKMLS